MMGNIVLCGFMGCGKTTVGKRLARVTGRRFIDLDQYIEKREGRTIAQIFAEEGEAGFREREAAAVREVAGREGLVIASGGGTVLFPRNVEAFHQAGGTILLLDVPLPLLQDRLKSDTRRPLLQVPDRRRVIAKLYRQRMPQYRKAADLRVRATAPPWVMARRLAETLGEGPKAGEENQTAPELDKPAGR